MKALLITTFFIMATMHANAQPAEDSVKMVINKMFTAMRKSNGASLKSCFTDSAVFHTIAIDRKTGERKVRKEEVSDFVAQITKLPIDSADERITYETIKIDADLASVWTPYQFYYNGKFSHCGVNSFQVVKVKGEWKIDFIIDTRRRDNCK